VAVATLGAMLSVATTAATEATQIAVRCRIGNVRA